MTVIWLEPLVQKYDGSSWKVNELVIPVFSGINPEPMKKMPLSQYCTFPIGAMPTLAVPVTVWVKVASPVPEMLLGVILRVVVEAASEGAAVTSTTIPALK